MAGRIDNAAREDAVAKASEVVLYENEIRSHLTQILASKAFRGSRRCQEFLSYVVERSLSGEFSEIKERMLGICIFDRDAGYDTSSDSIVRVTATDVRKRLLRYYETALASALHIDLPPGSYIPEFHHVAADSKASPLLVVEAGLERDLNGICGDHALGHVLEVVSTGSIEANWDTHDQTGGTWRRFHASSVRLALLVGSLCLAFLALGWSIGALHARDARQPFINPQYSFYKELLGPIATDPQQETTIVLSNPPLLVSQERDSPTAAGQEDGEKEVLLPPNLARKLLSRPNDTQAALPNYLASDTTDYTGMGEAQTAFELRKLFDILNRPTQLIEARFLNWEEARNQHLISLGPSMQTSGVAADYEISRGAIHNTHPRPGEPSLYEPRSDGNSAEDYGLIWMSQSASGSRMLVLAGLTSTGTAGVGSFFSDPNQMKPIFERLKRSSPDGSIPANWQVLLRITVRDDVPLGMAMVALRVPNTNR